MGVIVNEKECTTSITFKSPHACPLAVAEETATAPPASPASVGAPPAGTVSAPSAGSSSGSHWLLWTVFAAFLCYCIGGCAWKRRQYGVTGIEAMPHVKFWYNLPVRIYVAGVTAVAWLRNLVTGARGNAGENLPMRTQYEPVNDVFFDDCNDDDL